MTLLTIVPATMVLQLFNSHSRRFRLQGIPSFTVVIAGGGSTFQLCHNLRTKLDPSAHGQIKQTPNIFFSQTTVCADSLFDARVHVHPWNSQ